MKCSCYIVILICFISSFNVRSQCALGIEYPYTYNSSSLTVGTHTEMICCLWGNEFFTISNIVAGNTYTIDNCGAGLESELILFDPNNNLVAFSDDDCTTDDALISNYTPTITGNYKLQLNYNNVCSNIGYNAPIYITLNSTLDITEVDTQTTNISIYPNPSLTYFDLLTNLEVNGLILYDIRGKMVKSFSKTSGNYLITDLKPGLYFVKIKSDKGEFTKKILKL